MAESSSASSKSTKSSSKVSSTSSTLKIIKSAYKKSTAKKMTKTIQGQMKIQWRRMQIQTRNRRESLNFTGRLSGRPKNQIMALMCS